MIRAFFALVGVVALLVAIVILLGNETGLLR
jgi:hypothetical protein